MNGLKQQSKLQNIQTFTYSGSVNFLYKKNKTTQISRTN